MQVRQLFRYVFAKPQLTDEEKKTVPEHFLTYANITLSEDEVAKTRDVLTPLLNNRNFQLFVSYLKLQHIANALAIDVPEKSNDVLGIKLLPSAMESLDSKYGYLTSMNSPEEKAQLQQLAYLAFVILSMLGEELLVQNLYEQTYKMVVLFGDEVNPEHMFGRFDAHVQKHLDQPIVSILDFDLPQRQIGNGRYHLPHWRHLIQSPSVIDNLRLLAIADEICELQVQPVDIEKARYRASARLFNQRDKAPLLAQFCVAEFISERQFTAFVADDVSDRLPLLKDILMQLPMEKRLECLACLPNYMLSFEDLFKMANDIFDATEINKFFLKFKQPLLSYFTNVSLLKILSSVKKVEFLNIMLNSIDRQLLQNKVDRSNIFEVLEHMDGTTRYDFLVNRVGISIIRQLYSSAETYVERKIFDGFLYTEEARNFRELLLTDEEKQARDVILSIKNKIISRDFQVGNGGTPIDVGCFNVMTKAAIMKTVPNHVAIQWSIIQKCENGDIQYPTGLAKIREIANEQVVQANKTITASLTSVSAMWKKATQYPSTTEFHNEVACITPPTPMSRP